MFTANYSSLRVEPESMCSEKSASSLLGVNWVYDSARGKGGRAANPTEPGPCTR